MPLLLQLSELPVDTVEQPWAVTEEEREYRRDSRKTHLVFT